MSILIPPHSLHQSAFLLSSLYASSLEHLLHWGRQSLVIMLIFVPSLSIQQEHNPNPVEPNYSHSQSQFSSVQCSVMSDSLRPHGLQHARIPCPSPTLRACSNLCPSSQRCHPTILSVIPFSSLHQSFPPSESFAMSRFFVSCGQSIGVLASASVLPMNIQDWFPLGWTGWISLQSKRLSRVFSNTTVQKHQFFGAQLSL